MERRHPRRPAPHLRSPRQSPADRAAPWSAGVPAGLRHTFAPPAVSCRQRRPMERRRPRRPAPTLEVPQAISCRQRRRADRPWAGRPTDHARLGRWPARTPALQLAVAGEDTGAPELARPDVWSAPLERRRPRRPAPHLRLLRQSRADSAAVPTDRGPGGPRTMPACGGGRRGRRRSRTGGPRGMERRPMERRRPRRPAPTFGPSGSLVPAAPPCRPTVGREAQGPCPPGAVAGEDAGAPGAVAGEDTGAPELARPDVWSGPPWSAGVLAGLIRTLRHRPPPPRRFFRHPGGSGWRWPWEMSL